MGPDIWATTTEVVLSEFGRTSRENGDKGTNHGHGNVYWALGGAVRSEQRREIRSTSRYDGDNSFGLSGNSVPGYGGGHGGLLVSAVSYALEWNIARMQNSSPPRETVYRGRAFISQLRRIFLSAAIGALTATSGCGPTDEARLSPQSPPVEFDATEQALIGFALRKAERGIYNATLLEHHASSIAANKTVCGSFILQEDAKQRTQYFIAKSNDVSFAKSKEEDIWRNNC